MIIEKPIRTYAWFHDVTTQDIEVNRGEGIGAHKVLAGSPIDENGNVANDETAIGLLMETVSDANPDGKIIVAGDVDALGAKNASGIELSEAAKNALSGVTWRDPDYVVEMQSGGGGSMVVNINIDYAAHTISADKTFEEIANAAPSVICKMEDPDLGSNIGYLCTCGTNSANFLIQVPEIDNGSISSVTLFDFKVDTNNNWAMSVGAIVTN